MQYCLYLRKSRVDLEAELHGEGDTLIRHKKALLETAGRMNLSIQKIYEEIVSGETIAARPVMQLLLAEVEQGLWDGVLVMEVERLARGDTIDQGIVAQAFKYSNTKIITPSKVYDPNNEFDEEYFEFGLFMSRREYKTINRRLQRGRVASVQEGKYVGSVPPYGYVKKKLDHEKGYTLAPHPEQADVVRLIFQLYTGGESKGEGEMKRLGMSNITHRLNQLCIQPQKSSVWSLPSVRDILTNPVYIGKIRWNWRKQVKRSVDGEIRKTRPKAKQEDWIIVDGLHPPLVSSSDWEEAQNLMKQNKRTPLPGNRQMKNPLAGLILCSKCGRSMVRRPAGTGCSVDTLICPNPNCDNVSSPLPVVEERILSALKQLFDDCKITWLPSDNQMQTPANQQIQQKACKRLEVELAQTENQLNQLCDLLERGIYSAELFETRSSLLNDKKQQLQRDLLSLKQEEEESADGDRWTDVINLKADHLLDLYSELPDAQAKNSMLKEILVGATYLKTVNGRWHSAPDTFRLTLFPRFC